MLSPPGGRWGPPAQLPSPGLKPLSPDLTAAGDTHGHVLPELSGKSPSEAAIFTTRLTFDAIY